MSIITLRDPQSTFEQHDNRVFRDGSELAKGVVITQAFLERCEKELFKTISTWAAYPDIYLDMIKPSESNFDLFPYQRMFLRACMRYTTIYITAARATSKTFLLYTCEIFTMRLYS